MNEPADLSNFMRWRHSTLAAFAAETYARLKAEQDANEQLRQDLRAAMQLVRAANLKHNAP